MSSFSQTLYRWSEQHPRPMPWRQEKDPYKVWISEIMLQQTRVEQVTGYYHRFLGRFPSVQILAAATEQEVLKHWEGLGYNSRARNLHAAAKQVVNDYGGIFPNSYEGLLQLKGIGPYAAAAIASFAFEKAVPVLDVNVYRMAARIGGFTEAMQTPALRERVSQWLKRVFDVEQPARFNQAIMDFGAQQCLPRKPLCESCPFTSTCEAHKRHEVDLLPVKAFKAARKPLKLFYLVICTHRGLVLRQRLHADVWKGMFEFAEGDIRYHKAQPGALVESEYGSFKVVRPSMKIKQTLTHRNVEANFLVVKTLAMHSLPQGYFVASLAEIKKKYAVPGVIREFLANFEIPFV